MSAREPNLDRKTANLKAYLDTFPAAVAEPMSSSRSAVPTVLLYKVMGKMFAILSLRGDAFVIVKCDPVLADMLRKQYESIGHRSHLDKRFWISIDLDGDVPVKKIKQLAAQSYELVAAGLTRKQKAALAEFRGQLT